MCRNPSREVEKALAEMSVEWLVGMQAETVLAKVLVVKELRRIVEEWQAITFWP
jgi:hypothetical protein